MLGAMVQAGRGLRAAVSMHAMLNAPLMSAHVNINAVSSHAGPSGRACTLCQGLCQPAGLVLAITSCLVLC